MTQFFSSKTQNAKQAAGKFAANMIVEGMVVGLGTGSTAECFIEELGKRAQKGLKISAVATSEKSAALAASFGILLLDWKAVTHLDVTVDGADEIDAEKNMIKGGGGALLREKLLATSSHEMIVIVDEKKIVKHLGKHPLPVEIIPFLFHSTIQTLNKEGYQGGLRLDQNHSVFMTENGNYIYDIQFLNPIIDPPKEHFKLKKITGVVETGFFFGLAKRVVIGYEDGNVKIWKETF